MIFVRNLLRHKVRSIMTLLGAAVGISIYVTNAAITANLGAEVRQVMEDYNSDITVQGKGAASPLHSRIAPEDLVELQRTFAVTAEPLVIGALREPWNSYAVILGVAPSFASRFGVVEGRPPSPGSREIMAGTVLAHRLGLRVGTMLPLGDGEARIAGIHSMGNRLVDGAVVSDLPEAQRLLGREGEVNLALVHIRNKQQIELIARGINERFPRLHALTTADFVGNIRLFRSVETFTRAVALVSFFGCCLVVTNTLFMAVAERTGEIGILMAVGWRPWLVIRMLLAESLALCLAGTLLGNGLAMVVLRLLNNSQAIGFGWVPVAISPALFGLSLGVAVVLALVACIWPAFILLRVSPVEALRHE